jgi:hypothetical protein
MKKLALVIALAVELAVCGCGTSSPPNRATTTTNGNWEAIMTGGTGQGSLLNFVTAFALTTLNGIGQPLDVTGFGFINAGKCFTNGTYQENVAGSATLNAASSGAVTGTLTMTISSVNPKGNVLTLNGTSLTGTSNNTNPGQVGTLSNGVVVGNWTLTGATGCTGSGTFLMCQGTNTCTPP